MSDYSDPIARLREQINEMQWQAEKKRREARDLELVAAAIFDQSIQLDLLTDKLEKDRQSPLPTQTDERS